jgi:hypothetical protein
MSEGLEALQVLNGLFQVFDVVPETTEANIALMVKKPANFACRMAVVNLEKLSRSCFGSGRVANGALIAV